MADRYRRYAEDRFRPYVADENDEFNSDWRRLRRRRGGSQGREEDYGRGGGYGDAGRQGYGRGREMERWGDDRFTGREGDPLRREYEGRPFGPGSAFDRDDDFDQGRYAGRWRPTPPIYDDPERSARYGRDRDERGLWSRMTDEVSSWFGDEEAERRREMDHRGRGPRGYTRSSERIREDVCDRLSDDYIVDASDIEVTVSGTEVTLSGAVANRMQRRRAEDCAESVSGVTHVQNNLRVNQDRARLSGAAGGAGSTSADLSSTQGLTGDTRSRGGR